MNLTRDRLHTIGWGTAMAICLALVAVLTTRVNAVKAQVALTDRQIALVSREKLYLDTEFETRANQQQLRAMNDVDFGYTAPTAAQYLKSERDLAALGKPAAADAPAPIRYAAADTGAASNDAAAQAPSLASRLIGVARAAELPSARPPAPLKVASASLNASPNASPNASLNASLNERLSRLDRGAGGPTARGVGGEAE